MSYIDDYHRDGVVVISGAFSLGQANDIRIGAWLAFAGSDIDAPYKSGRRTQYTRGDDELTMQFWPALTNATLNLYRINPNLRGIVHEVLGDDVKQLNNQIYFKTPGVAGDCFNWHVDGMFRKHMSADAGPDDYLQTIICIDEMTEENGTIMFDLGSHRRPGNYYVCSKEHLREAPMMDGDEVPIEAEPGDVVIWHQYTVHGSGENKSNGTRMTYMNGFAKASACEDGVWPDYLVDGEVVEEADASKLPYN